MKIYCVKRQRDLLSQLVGTDRWFKGSVKRLAVWMRLDRIDEGGYLIYYVYRYPNDAPIRLKNIPISDVWNYAHAAWVQKEDIDISEPIEILKQNELFVSEAG